ncbi:hypothetical protein HJB81_07345 [Rhizobium sp. NZLR1]|nr:hypothetical protein [Rhizobium sp. NZLR1]QSZ23060.1 hypothetical protein J3O30_11200 [Rhizobium sp. NZLR1]
MRLGSIVRSVQVFVVVLMMAVNPFGMVEASPAVPNQHQPSASEQHRDAGNPCGNLTACCSTMHCCPILPQLASIAAPLIEPGIHERMSAEHRPLLLTRAIDPPPRSLPG